MRRNGQGSLNALSIPQITWLDTLRSEIPSHPDLQSFTNKIEMGETLGPWYFKAGLLWYQHKLFISAKSNLNSMIITSVRNLCHEGYQKTLFRIAREFYLSGIRSQIHEFVATCLVCQRNKVEHLKLAGFLQPLPIPQHVWTVFIESLPTSQGKNVILVVVDRISKYAHFVAHSHQR